MIFKTVKNPLLHLIGGRISEGNHNNAGCHFLHGAILHGTDISNPGDHGIGFARARPSPDDYIFINGAMLHQKLSQIKTRPCVHALQQPALIR